MTVILTKIKNHNESWVILKKFKTLQGNTKLFLLEHVHWDNRAETPINIKGSLNSFISDDIRRLCSQFRLTLQIKPKPRDNWKRSSMVGMGRFEVSLLPKLHPPQVLVAGYLKDSMSHYLLYLLKPEWLDLVFLPTFFHLLFKSSICEGRGDSEPARFNQEHCCLQVHQFLWSFLHLMLGLRQKQIT